MVDRELLGLAAKAAGYEVFWIDHEWVGGRDDVKQMLTEEYQHFIIGHNKKWNPLGDDGDALRLEVDTNITTKHRFLEILAEENAACNGCYRKARRRAIVRAAAEIGMKMNEH